MPRSKKLGDNNSKRSKNANKQIGSDSTTKFAESEMLQRAAFVGLDVHKKTIRMSVLDADGNELANGAIPNTEDGIRDALQDIPHDARMVMESSSVWKAPFFQIRDDLGYNIILSNPYTTKLIAVSKKKTDKVDAKILADMLRGGYITKCHVPSKERMANRDLVRYRKMLVDARTIYRNFIHGILLQNRITIPGTPFYAPWTAQIRQTGDYRIYETLRQIDSVNESILKMDMRVSDAAGKDPDAKLIMSIPGFGAYSALTVASEIDGIERFSSAHNLCAFAGIVPSVRSSGDATHHGHITRHGSTIMRYVLVQAIRSHVRFAKKSSVTAFYNRVAKRRGKGIAAVAAASLLMRVIHRMLREREEFVMNHG